MDFWDRLFRAEFSRRQISAGLAALPLGLHRRWDFFADLAREDSTSRVPRLNESMLDRIAAMREEGTLKQGEDISFYAFDPQNREVLAHIDPARKLRIASVGKVGVATAYLDATQEGLLTFGPKSAKHLHYALTSFISRRGYYDPVIGQLADGNVSTTWMINRLGQIDEPNDARAWTRLGLARVREALGKYEPVFDGVEITGEYPSDGREYRNRGTVAGCARAFCALMRDDPRLTGSGLATDLPTLPRSDLLRQHLAQALSDRLVSCAPHVSNRTKLVHKTGTTILTVADAGYVLFTDARGDYRPLVLSGIIEGPESRAGIENIAARRAAFADFTRRGNVAIGTLSDIAALAHNARYDVREVKA